MCIINISLDTESQDFVLTLDGKKIKNVSNVSISLPLGYDEKDNKCGCADYITKPICNFTVHDHQDDIVVNTGYSTAKENAKAYSKRFSDVFIMKYDKKKVYSRELEELYGK